MPKLLVSLVSWALLLFIQDEEEKKKSDGGSGRKEQSVLQAKLTNLAIKIGYIGEADQLSLFSSWIAVGISGWLAAWLQLVAEWITDPVGLDERLAC